MKKINFIFTLFLTIIMVTTLCSCTKTIPYQICGFYIELNEVDKYSVDDQNPKVYFKYSENDMFSTKSGSYATFQNSTKMIKDEEIRKYYFSTDMLIPADKYDDINIHLIILKNGKYIVENEIHKKINKSGSCKYAAEYKYDNKEYRVEFKLEIKLKEN